MIRDGRPRPTLRCLLYLVVTLAVLFGGPEAVFRLASLLLGATEARRLAQAGLLFGLVFPIVYLLIVLGITYLFRNLLDGHSLRSLGLSFTPGWARELGLGIGLGALLMTLILAIELLSGAYVFSGFAWDRRPIAEIGVRLAFPLWLFVVVGVNEELISRGYVFQNLEADWGTAAAVAVSSAIFALFHLLNPGTTVLSTAGLVVAGLLFAVCYLVTRRLWLPIGLHFAWNFFEGPIYGFLVSGLQIGGLLHLTPAGPAVLTGGDFGPEASIVAVVSELLGVVLVLVLSRRLRVARETDLSA